MLGAYKIPDISLFRELTEEERQNLLRGGKMKSFSVQEYLCRHNEPVNHFFILCRGKVRLARAMPDGHELTTEILMAGDMVGEIEILESIPFYQSSASAIEQVSALQFPHSWLKDSAQKNGRFALNLLSAIAKSARQSKIEAEHQATMSAPQLVACFLQRICAINDFDPKGFDLPYSKTLIASRLGMELETFSRALAKLKEHGVSVDGSRVIFHDFMKVKKFVCGNCSISHDCPTHQAVGNKVKNKKSA